MPAPLQHHPLVVLLEHYHQFVPQPSSSVLPNHHDLANPEDPYSFQPVLPPLPVVQSRVGVVEEGGAVEGVLGVAAAGDEVVAVGEVEHPRAFPLELGGVGALVEGVAVVEHVCCGFAPVLPLPHSALPVGQLLHLLITVIASFITCDASQVGLFLLAVVLRPLPSQVDQPLPHVPQLLLRQLDLPKQPLVLDLDSHLLD